METRCTESYGRLYQDGWRLDDYCGARGSVDRLAAKPPREASSASCSPGTRIPYLSIAYHALSQYWTSHTIPYLSTRHRVVAYHISVQDIA
eukprot:1612930-Rhodomonas_salina.3